MKITNSKPILNFLPRRILLLALFIPCFGMSSYSQNLFSVEVQNLTNCAWTKVEAFDASNNSLGVYSSTTTMPAGMGIPFTIMSCLPQASQLDHFVISSACGLTTVPLTGATMCNFPPCSSSIISVSSGIINCSGNPGQLFITLN